MDKAYHPHSIETKWYHKWESQHCFAPKKASHAFCIMLPPPNVTGSLHMGHAFQDTLMDALIRFHRMKGENTFWQGGTDHAGIATQMVVERQLLQQGITRQKLGRDAFIDKIWEWKEQSGNKIVEQMRRLGTSIDWRFARFTMDEGLSEAVKEVFVRLHDEGLIYRGKRLVNWDPTLHTAVSDLEVVSQEEEGNLWYIKYPLASNHNQFIVVATTRPETLLGDTAVAVHPEDSRFKHLIGQKAQLPLSERLIPIIAYDSIDPEFGTGCVKITPAHDFNDYEIGKRHGLAMINIFTEDARLNHNVPHQYQGLNRFKAREHVVSDLEKAKLLEKIEPHTLKVPRGDRTNDIVEPYLTSQWYVSVKSLADDAIQAVKSGRIKFVPENWSNTYFDWLDNIQDWCISRQLWWGHRIPAWYDEHDNIYVGRNETEVRLKYNLGPHLLLRQDEDVLDTWFSSALWPFSTLGWPNKTEALATYYPTNVLVTGFDIIFFWVARMIMMGLKFMGEVPFKTVFVHGLIQDSEGRKMSKSKGNTLDPLDIIDGIELPELIHKRVHGLMQPQMAEKVEADTLKHFPKGIPAYGTDALRFTYCALCTTGRHIRFDTERVEGYRNFCNKLWNAARFVIMNTEGKSLGQGKEDRQFTLADQWIWSQLQHLKAQVTKHFEDFRFDLLAQAIYEFTWDHYCDWYLELTKPILNNPDSAPAAQNATRYTLLAVLEELLRITHPIMPFITEEIWQRVMPLLSPDFDPSRFLMLASYPTLDKNLINEEAHQTISWLQTFVLGVRKIRGEMNISPSKTLIAHYQGGNEKDRLHVEQHQSLLKSLVRLDSLTEIPTEVKPSVSATALVGEMNILIPMKDLIDKDSEILRLIKEINKFTKDIQRFEQKLSNKDYIEKAPKAIVIQEQEKLRQAVDFLQRLEKQRQNIEKL
ncbi:MAG TPA: valine--tRNA ligase [Gammaproteobacteria bacterium]|nr:valine--tRNA ligase [Gammaproteobacteria bacterium]